MKTACYRNTLEVFGIFCISFLIFTWGLSTQEIIGFESRFYLFALEMWRHGISWFPSTYHEPYPDYPAASTLLIYLTAKLLGGMNKLAAVLPSAIAASITVTLTYMIGSLQHKRWGFFAVLFMMLTFTFLKYARTISLDMYLAMVTAGCFYLIYSADIKHLPRRVWWIYPLIFLGFVFRGPIGLVIPTGVVCAYYFFNKNAKQFFLSGFLASLLLIISSAVLLALAYHVGGTTFMHDVVRMEVGGRLDSSFLPVYFYFTDSMGGYALAYPCAVLVILGVCYALFARQAVPQRAFLKNVFIWMVVILVGMSIPGDKKLRYVLPMIPAAALLAAGLFAAPFSQPYFHFLRRQLLRVFLYLPALLALAVEFVFFYAQKNLLNFNIHYSCIFVVLTALQLINFWLLYRAINTHRVNEALVMLIAALSFIITYLGAIEPIALYIDRARDLVVAVESMRLQNHAQLVFYRERSDGLPVKYLINMPQEETPVFLDSQQALESFSSPAFFVTSEDYFTSLPRNVAERYKIIANNTLGHARVVIFTQNLRKTKNE